MNKNCNDDLKSKCAPTRTSTRKHEPHTIPLKPREPCSEGDGLFGVVISLPPRASETTATQTLTSVPAPSSSTPPCFSSIRPDSRLPSLPLPPPPATGAPPPSPLLLLAGKRSAPPSPSLPPSSSARCATGESTVRASACAGRDGGVPAVGTVPERIVAVAVAVGVVLVWAVLGVAGGGGGGGVDLLETQEEARVDPCSWGLTW